MKTEKNRKADETPVVAEPPKAPPKGQTPAPPATPAPQELDDKELGKVAGGIGN